MMVLLLFKLKCHWVTAVLLFVIILKSLDYGCLEEAMIETKKFLTSLSKFVYKPFFMVYL